MGHRVSVFAGLKLEKQAVSAGAWAARRRNLAIVSKLLLVVFVVGLLAQAQTISTFAGGGPPNGLSATTVPVGDPWGVVQDSAGNTYVSDNITNRVFKIDTSENFSVVAGNGVKGFSGDGGLATAATLNGPEGIAIDSNNVLYIADTGNNVIRAVNTSASTQNAGGISIGAGNIATVAGSAGQVCATPTAACGDGGPAIQAQLNAPAGVAIDPLTKNVLIADTLDNKIRKVTASTAIISTVAGTGTAGAPTNGTATSSELSGPVGVYVDGSGNLFIADTVNNEIEEVTGTTLTAVAATVGKLLAPNAVFVDATGDIFIADSNDNIIRELSGGTLNTIAGNGLPCTPPPSLPTCEGATALSSYLNFPTGVFVNSSGTTFWIADQNDDVILAVDVASNAVSIFTGIYFNRAYYGLSGVATSAELLHPSGMNFDSAGNLLVADTDNSAIRKIDTSGNISTVAGTGTACNTQTCGDGGLSASGTLALPSDVALDAAGNIYIADTEDHAIRVINTTSSVLKFFLNTTNELDVLPGDIETVAGTISTVCPTPPSCGDNAPATLAFLNAPGGLFLDKSGNIYIADTGDNVIRFVNTQALGTPSIKIGTVSVAPGNIATVAGNYTACATATGTNPCGDAASASLANLNGPSSVFVDTAGNIYIVDTFDNRIRVVNPQASGSVSLAGVTINAGDIATIAGNGDATYSGDGHIATSASLAFPGGVFVVDTNIFIADQANSVVRVVNSLSGNIQTAVGTGVSGSTGDGGPPLSAELARPIGVRTDSSGNLYISDGSAARVRKVTDLLATPPTAAVAPLGIPFGTQALGTTSTGQTVTVTNNGILTNLAVSSVAISGADAGDFKQTNNCSSVIPGTFCTITVTFAPTATGQRSATLNVTDNATGSPQAVALSGTAVVPFTLPQSGNLSPASVSAGGSATATITVTWGGSSNTAVALSCKVEPSAAPTAPTCSLSPSSVTPKSGTANSTMTIKTTAPTSSALQPAILHGSGIFTATWLFLPAMVLSTAGLGGSRRKKTLSYFLLTLAIAGSIFLVACGGGNSSSNNKGNGGGSGGASGTASGTYEITVTATSSGLPTQTENFTLTVK